MVWLKTHTGSKQRAPRGKSGVGLIRRHYRLSSSVRYIVVGCISSWHHLVVVSDTEITDKAVVFDELVIRTCCTVTSRLNYAPLPPQSTVIQLCFGQIVQSFQKTSTNTGKINAKYGQKASSVSVPIIKHKWALRLNRSRGLFSRRGHDLRLDPPLSPAGIPTFSIVHQPN